MNRLSALARLAGQASRKQFTVSGADNSVTTAALVEARRFMLSAQSSFHSSAQLQSTLPTDVAVEMEHATGPEREELESTQKGIDPWHENWLDAPFGTAENPVEVPSEFDHRVVGVPDPDDDSLVWWGIIEDGKPAKQIIEEGEYFVLKRIASSGEHH